MNTYPSTIEFDLTPDYHTAEWDGLEKVEAILLPTPGESAVFYTEEDMLILRGVGSIVRDLPESNGKRKVDIDGDRGDEWVHDDQKRTGGNDDEGGDDCGDRVDL